MKKRYGLVLASLLSLTSWIGFSNATVNQNYQQDKLSLKTEQQESVKAIREGNIELAYELFQNSLESIESFTAVEKSKIWMFYSVVLDKKDFTDPAILLYLDKAIALKEFLPKKQHLALLNLASARAMQQRKHTKQLEYLAQWFALTEESHPDRSQKSLMAASAHFSLKQYPTAIAFLNRIIDNDIKFGRITKENTFSLLVASHMKNNEYSVAYDVLQEQINYYPSVKRQKQLVKISKLI